jgi:hypothetical protein
MRNGAYYAEAYDYNNRPYRLMIDPATGRILRRRPLF